MSRLTRLGLVSRGTFSIRVEGLDSISRIPIELSRTEFDEEEVVRVEGGRVLLKATMNPPVIVAATPAA